LVGADASGRTGIRHFPDNGIGTKLAVDYDMNMRLSLLAVAVVFTSFACGTASPTVPTATPDVTISMVGDRGNQSYAPNPTTIRVGQTVAWKNNDTTPHDATQDASRFQTGTVNAGATSGPITLTTAGTFAYHCTIHPGMVGTIVVQ
jgi:plastocyanin